jgi:glucose-6-phosphate isomerase
LYPLYGDTDHHDNCLTFFAQTEALLHGKSAAVVQAEFQKARITGGSKFLLPFKVFAGNKPTNTILIDTLSPKR